MPDPSVVPAYRTISIVVSQGCELSRWMMERGELPFTESFNAPLLHVLSTAWVGGGLEAPVVVTPTALWTTLSGILAGIDAFAAPGRNVYGDTASERLANQQLMQNVLANFGPVRQYVYDFVLPDKSVMAPLAVAGVPWWQRAIVYGTYPLYRPLLRRALGITDQTKATAPGIMAKGFQFIDDELARRATPFLCGDEPGGIDCAISALTAPVVFPPEYGGLLPDLDRVPQELRDFVMSVRARPCGQLTLETYRRVRNRRPLPFEVQQ